MKIKTAILENNEAVREQLTKMLEETEKFDIVDFPILGDGRMYPTLESMPMNILFENADIITSQIRSNLNDGINAALALWPDLILVVYSTKDIITAAEATELDCAEYFTFPVSKPTFDHVVHTITHMYKRALKKAEREKKAESRSKRIMIKTSEGYQMSEVHDILYVEKYDRKIRMLTTTGERVIAGYTLDDLEVALKDYNFYRCYQSHIVNLSRAIKATSDSRKRKYFVVIEGADKEIPVSRDKYNELVELMKSIVADMTI